MLMRWWLFTGWMECNCNFTCPVNVKCKWLQIHRQCVWVSVECWKRLTQTNGHLVRLLFHQCYCKRSFSLVSLHLRVKESTVKEDTRGAAAANVYVYRVCSWNDGEKLVSCESSTNHSWDGRRVDNVQWNKCSFFHVSIEETCSSVFMLSRTLSLRASCLMFHLLFADRLMMIHRHLYGTHISSYYGREKKRLNAGYSLIFASLHSH